MLFRDISFGMIILILAEIRQAHFQQIRILLFFFFFFFVLPVFSICNNCESMSQNLELAILNHTGYLITINSVDNSKQWSQQIISFEQIHFQQR